MANYGQEIKDAFRVDNIMIIKIDNALIGIEK